MLMTRKLATIFLIMCILGSSMISSGFYSQISATERSKSSINGLKIFEVALVSFLIGLIVQQLRCGTVAYEGLSGHEVGFVFFSLIFVAISSWVMFGADRESNMNQSQKGATGFFLFVDIVLVLLGMVCAYASLSHEDKQAVHLVIENLPHKS